MLLPKLLFALLTAVAPAPKHYSFAVNVVGNGKPMILIPGLACGGDVWNTTVDHYKKDFKCYVLTLPGFAGQPPIAAPILPKVRDEIIDYITDNHLEKPVLIGHSLGGTMVLWIAATAPDKVGKLVAVDGVPYLPSFIEPTAKPETIKSQAEMIRKMMASQSQSAFAASEKGFLSTMITSPKDVETVDKTSSLSDPKSVGEAMAEMYSNDLRPLMSNIRVPVLEVGEGAYATTDNLKKANLEAYEAQLHLIPTHSLKVSNKSRHFIMLDDPDFFFKEIDDFLK
jgi:pimeloyl-ACP methyl ester carboxylesterase